jgi:large subunit ribosomal protein L15e
MYRHIAETWKSMLKTRSQYLKDKAYLWRREPTIHRIDTPSRLDRARALGYKAKLVAQRRVGEKFLNLKVLGSYFLYKDGQYSWFEVILIDPNHPVIIKDKEIRSKLNFN